VINDWLDDEAIDKTYPLHCYGDAIKHIPDDLRAYSSIVDDIHNARQQLVRSSENLRVPASHKGSRGKGATKSGSPASKSAAQAANPPRKLFTEAFNKVGPRNADSIPLPLIILAGLALLLIAAGGAGLVSRRLRARKIAG
jgi:Alphavirus glycoprotein J